MTTKPKPSERYHQLVIAGYSRERAMHIVLLAYLDEQHAAGQGAQQQGSSGSAGTGEGNHPEATPCEGSAFTRPAQPDELEDVDPEVLAAVFPELEGAAEARPEAATESVRSFARAILHGDGKHRAWLLSAADSFCRGVPIEFPVVDRDTKPDNVPRHRTPPRNPSAAFGSDDCKTCCGLRRVRKGDRGLWELCPECWAKDGAGNAHIAEPPSPESLPHRAGLPLPTDTDEPPSPVAGEPDEPPVGAILVVINNALPRSSPWHARLTGIAERLESSRDTLKSKLASVEAERDTLKRERDESDNYGRQLMARIERGDALRFSDAEKAKCVLESHQRGMAHALGLEHATDTVCEPADWPTLEDGARSLVKTYHSLVDEFMARGSALAEAKARAERLEGELKCALGLLAISNKLDAAESAPSQPPQDAQPGQRLYPNGPELVLQNPPGYVCWKCGAKPKPQTVLDPSQPEPVAGPMTVEAQALSPADWLPNINFGSGSPVQPVEGVAVGGEKRPRFSVLDQHDLNGDGDE